MTHPHVSSWSASLPLSQAGNAIRTSRELPGCSLRPQRIRALQRRKSIRRRRHVADRRHSKHSARRV